MQLQIGAAMIHKSCSNWTRRSVVLAGATAGLGVLAGFRRDASVGASVAGQANLSEAELRRADQRVQLCSGSNLAGGGLRGEYFATQGCQGDRLLVRTDGPVDFDDSLEWPVDAQLPRPRSVRWSGWLRPPMSGRYGFQSGFPGARITVAKQSFGAGSESTDARVELAAGRYYPVSIEVDELSRSRDRLRLEWTAPHGSRFLVPRALLFLPTGAATT